MIPHVATQRPACQRYCGYSSSSRTSRRPCRRAPAHSRGPSHQDKLHASAQNLPASSPSFCLPALRAKLVIFLLPVRRLSAPAPNQSNSFRNPHRHGDRKNDSASKLTTSAKPGTKNPLVSTAPFLFAFPAKRDHVLPSCFSCTATAVKPKGCSAPGTIWVTHSWCPQLGTSEAGISWGNAAKRPTSLF